MPLKLVTGPANAGRQVTFNLGNITNSDSDNTTLVGATVVVWAVGLSVW